MVRAYIIPISPGTMCLAPHFYARTLARAHKYRYLCIAMQIESPYKLGAHRGITLGLALSTMFFASVFSYHVPLLGAVTLFIFAAVPFWLYRKLRATYVSEAYSTTLSSLWMQGIVIFTCGSLICALLSTIYMRLIDPGFVMRTLHTLIDMYRELPDPNSAQVADMLQRMIDAHAVPSAVSISMEIVWLGIFSGSILSLLMALLARARGGQPSNHSNTIS